MLNRITFNLNHASWSFKIENMIHFLSVYTTRSMNVFLSPCSTSHHHRRSHITNNTHLLILKISLENVQSIELCEWISTRKPYSIVRVPPRFISPLPFLFFVYFFLFFFFTLNPDRVTKRNQSYTENKDIKIIFKYVFNESKTISYTSDSVQCVQFANFR